MTDSLLLPSREIENFSFSNPQSSTHSCRAVTHPYTIQQEKKLDPQPILCPAIEKHSAHLEVFKFQQALRKYLPLPIDLKLNENSSHFVSIRFSSTMRPISASIHKVFVDAPSHIIETLARYIQKKGRDPSLTRILREYISAASLLNKHPSLSKRKNYDATHAQGTTYNLLHIAESLNSQFFTPPVQAQIIWFHNPKRQRPITRCALGLYFDELNLIKINAKLDNPHVPKYVVSLVVYHEMLHAIHPPKVFPSGKRIIHTPEFRAAERLHPNFLDAEQWLDQNRNRFFHSL